MGRLQAFRQQKVRHPGRSFSKIIEVFRQPSVRRPVTDVVEMLQKNPFGVQFAGDAELAHLLLGLDPVQPGVPVSLPLEPLVIDDLLEEIGGALGGSSGALAGAAIGGGVGLMGDRREGERQQAAAADRQREAELLRLQMERLELERQLLEAERRALEAERAAQ